MRRTTLLAPLCVSLAVLVAGCARHAPAPDSQPPPEATSALAKERRDVPAPTPVSQGGIRYEAVPWGRARGLPQNGGYVAAIDEATGAELWLTRIYDAPPADDREGDKRDVFITRLELSADRQFLLVTNELGAVYRLDLRTRSVVRGEPGGPGARMDR